MMFWPLQDVFPEHGCSILHVTLGTLISVLWPHNFTFDGRSDRLRIEHLPLNNCNSKQVKNDLINYYSKMVISLSQKVVTSFLLKLFFYQNSPKSHRRFGYFCKKMFHIIYVAWPFMRRQKLAEKVPLFGRIYFNFVQQRWRCKLLRSN